MSSVTWPLDSPQAISYIGGPLEASLYLEIFNGVCDAMVDTTLNDL